MPYPDYDQFIARAWGWPNEDFGAISMLACGLGIRVGGNPPYSVLDFLATYPDNFLGDPTAFQGVTDGITANVMGLNSAAGLAVGQLVVAPGIPAGSSIASIATGTLTPTGTLVEWSTYITGLSDFTGLYAGQPISGDGIPDGTVITAAGRTAIQISEAATLGGTDIDLVVSTVSLTLSSLTTAAFSGALSIYTGAFIPLPVLNAYIALASGSLQVSVWGSGWSNAMDLYVAHFATLWMRTQGRKANNAGQAAAAGLARGILTAKAADGVSASFTPTPGLEAWGAWNLTEYGQLLATFAMIAGSQSLLIY